MTTPLNSIQEIRTSIEGYTPSKNPFNRYTHEANEFSNDGRHVRMPGPGVLVSTGTLRSFTNLVYCHQKHPDLCQGLVVMDVNPNACAYIHITALFLKHSTDRREFTRMAMPLKKISPAKQEKIVSEILEKEGRSEKTALQAVYTEHVAAFAEYYFNPERYEGAPFEALYDWAQASEDHFPINPFRNDDHYRILKDYAQQGKIIAVAKNIGDLKFLQEAGHTISIVDVSNILEYELICLTPLRSACTICWTALDDELRTQYLSETYQPLNEPKQEALMKLIEEMGIRELKPDSASPLAPMIFRTDPSTWPYPTKFLWSPSSLFEALWMQRAMLSFPDHLKKNSPSERPHHPPHPGPGKERLCSIQ